MSMPAVGLQRVRKFPQELSSEDVQRADFNPARLLPTFYSCPYADPNPGQANDYSIKYYPKASIPCDFNFAFININDLTELGTEANTTTDNYMIHLRDPAAIHQLAMRIKDMDRTIQVSYIDDPDCSWAKVLGKHLANFIRNTEGEINTDDGSVFTGNVKERYLHDGRMMDAETSGGDPSDAAFSDVIQGAFLQGIQMDPDNYRFIYCSYADRSIDAILNQKFTGKNDAQKELMKLGFTCISDFITKRSPELSQIHTMSYGGSAQGMLAEGDTYAMKLANGDKSKLYDMRKYISIGVSPNITSPDVAKQLAPACDPAKAKGFRSFMVWAGNSPNGMAMMEAMTSARSKPVPPSLMEAFTREKDLASEAPFPMVNEKSPELRAEFGGNRDHFAKAEAYQIRFNPGVSALVPGLGAARAQVAEKQVTAAEKASAPEPERTWRETAKSVFSFGIY